VAAPETVSLVARLRERVDDIGEDEARGFFETGIGILDHAAEALDRAALRANS
jgi:hypothetical protein